MAAAGGVGVRQLIHRDQRGRRGQRRIEIELGELAAPVLEALARQYRQSFEQRLGLLAAMGLDDAHAHRHAFALALVQRLQHRVSLADARTGAEEELEPAAPLARLIGLHFGEQAVGIGAVGRSAHGPSIMPQGPRSYASG